jgi:hypothetical protein
MNAPRYFPLELVNDILSYGGEHEIVNGQVIRRVRKIPDSDYRFNTIEQIQPWYGYHIYNSEQNEHVISVSLHIGEDDNGDVYYNLRKTINIDKYGLENTFLNVNVQWEYRRAYDIIQIEQNRIINNNEIVCVKQSTRDEYEYYYEPEEEMDIQEE